MKKHDAKKIDIEASSGNVFADLGLPNAEKLKIKSGLTIEIAKAIRKLGLTQAEAAERMGLTQPKVSALLNGDVAHIPERKLMDCLNCLTTTRCAELKIMPYAECRSARPDSSP